MWPAARLFTICCGFESFLCGFVNAYDWELYPLTLPQFQQDLNISEADIGLVSGAVRWGNALSLPLCYLGDVHGRKRMMLVSSAAYLVLTNSRNPRSASSALATSMSSK